MPNPLISYPIGMQKPILEGCERTLCDLRSNLLHQLQHEVEVMDRPRGAGR